VIVRLTRDLLSFFYNSRPVFQLIQSFARPDLSALAELLVRYDSDVDVADTGLARATASSVLMASALVRLVTGLLMDMANVVVLDVFNYIRRAGRQFCVFGQDCSKL